MTEETGRKPNNNVQLLEKLPQETAVIKWRSQQNDAFLFVNGRFKCCLFGSGVNQSNGSHKITVTSF
jgi:hypothetical protein